MRKSRSKGNIDMLLGGGKIQLGGAAAGAPRSALKALASQVNAVAAPERKLRDPREENVPGDFYVDSTCIGESFAIKRSSSKTLLRRCWSAE